MMKPYKGQKTCMVNLTKFLGSTIKYNHSDPVIAYYTRWYAVHSVPTSYLCYPYIT